MIRRFKLETEGTSLRDCERQINDAVRALLEIEGTEVEAWEVTDDVTWKNREGGYCSRVVMKLKESVVS